MMEMGNRRMQYLAGFVGNMGCMTFGVYSTWVAPVIPKLQSGGEKITITADQGSWLASVTSLTPIAATCATSLLFDSFGRKTLLLASAVPYVVGFVWQVFATSFWELMASRIVNSFGGGISAVAFLPYLVEIADDDVRGAIVSVYQLMYTLGMLFDYAVGPYVDVATFSGILICFPVLFCLCFIWMPESPHYLVLKGRRADAKKALLRLRGLKEPCSMEHELDKIDRALKQQRTEKGNFRDFLVLPGNRRSLLIVLVLGFFSVTTGTFCLQSYANEIFQRSGADVDANVSAILLGVVQLVSSVVAPLLVDRVGRRPLLMTSFIGCSLSLMAEGVYFYIKDGAGHDVSRLAWLPLAGILGSIASFAIGLGFLLMTVVGEIFPSSVKGFAVGTVIIFSNLLLFGEVKLFQVVSDSLGIYVSFWTFSVLSAVGCVHVYLTIPETKKRPLTDIVDEMHAMDSLIGGVKEVRITVPPES